MRYLAHNLPQNKHGFFGKKGGVSEGKYDGLNINHKSLDSFDNIEKNLNIVASEFAKNKNDLNILIQGVSADVVYVENPSFYKILADGCVTKNKDIILGIKTADCAPVLFADYQNGVIGAAHAGWRGALKGVLENTVKLMLEKGADLQNIKAAIGPCIGQKSYEVDEPFYQQFLDCNAEYKKYFMAGKAEGFYQFSLSGFVLDKLKNIGITDVCNLDMDTYSLEDKFYSFRRNTHKNLIAQARDYPVEISCITL